MSTRSQLTKDLNESVKALLARRVKILLKNVVRLEIKADKTENKVLVFSPCRLFVLASKVPTRIDFHFHYLEIQAIESKKLNQLCLTVGDKLYSFLTMEESGSGETDAMIQALSTAIRNIFPTVPLTHIIRKVDVQPPQRIQHIRDAELAMRHGSESRGIGPCGGFSTQYACMCDFHGHPYREEVAWDVDTIYLAHGTRVLNLREFDYLIISDMISIISALEFNTWFTALRASHIKLSHEVIDRILHVVRKSLSLECLYLDNLQVKWDFAHKLSLALIANSNSVVHTLDLSHNLIEDKGAASLCGFFAKVQQGASQLVTPISKAPKGLVHLNLSHCGLTNKGVNQICQSLSINKCMDNTLTYLNLSDNSLKDDITNLCNFLAQPNVLNHLDISNTECTLETIFGALLRGCATHLVHLNVSRNSFSIKNSSKSNKQELPLSFKQFFTSVLNLKHINISSCKLPLEPLKHLLLGLACNECITNVVLDISYNNLSTHGAHVLESCIHGVRCLSTLDITESNIDMDLSSIITAISKNKSLKTLIMNKNLINIKTKHIATVIDALVALVQEDDCSIQTLSISDCKLKNEMSNLLSAFGNNNSLQVIDITGNFIGDPGARLLAKSIQINTSIHTIHYDKNNISILGYNDIAYALENNTTLQTISFPTHDIIPCMKLNVERTENILKKIQNCLSRNILNINNNKIKRRLNINSALLNNSNYIIDKLISQQQEIIKVVSEGESCDKVNEINHATSLIEDADHCKSLIGRLNEYVQRYQEPGNDIDVQFANVAEQLSTTINSYMQTTTDAMLKCAKEQCPTVMSDERISSDILNNNAARMILDVEQLRLSLIENAGTQIMNKVCDMNSAIATNIAETICEKVIEALSKSYKCLLGESKTRPSTPDVLRSMSRDSSNSSRNDSFLLSSDSSPIATPHLHKRKSVNKLRPKSVVDSIEGLSADDIPDLLPSLPPSAEESLDSVSELPSSRGPLQHLVKSRPKRAKTRAPTRGTPVRIPNTNILDEGLDNFFVPNSSQSNTPVLSPISDDNSSISSLVTDTTLTPTTTPSHTNNNSDNIMSSSMKIENVDSSEGTPLGRTKLLSSSFDNVPRSRSSDNVGAPSYKSMRSDTVDLGKIQPEEPTVKADKIDGMFNFKRNTKITGTAMDIIKAKKATKESETVSEITTSTSSSTTLSSPTNNGSSNVASLVKLRSTAISENLKSPANGMPPKSPLPKYAKDNKTESNTDKTKPALLSNKPRPWSMMDSDRKSSEYTNITNITVDHPSENTDGPQSLPVCINEKRSVRDIAAAFKLSGSESPEVKKKPFEINPSSASANTTSTGIGFRKPPIPQPRPSLISSPFLGNDEEINAKKSSSLPRNASLITKS